MNEFVRILQKDINKKIEVVERAEDHPIDKASKAFKILGDGFIRLKEFIVNYQFKDENEEIEFFKEIKPKLFSRLIYYRKLYNIEMNRPVACIETQKEYLSRELEAINLYTSKRLDFIRYYRSGSTYLDRLYFLRGEKDTEQYLESFYYELDPHFSTNCDFKVTRILANDILSVYLLGELEILDCHNKKTFGLPFPETRITWRDTKVGLIELIYALDSKKVFGKEITLMQLANYLANVFNVQMDMNLSRTFTDMKIRNIQTPWLNDLLDALLKRMQFWRNNKK